MTFSLVRVPIGSGTFARTKIILLHINSEECSLLRRSKINARKVEVRRAVGEVTLDLELSSVADVTLEKVLEAL